MSQRSTLPILLMLTGVVLLLLAACGGQPTETPSPPELPEPPTVTKTPVMLDLVGDSLRGGLLYDKWWTLLGLDAPEEDHPLWATQTTNERSGADTWRCKECHGWDYKGADGAYGSGSHMTGFVGVFQLAGSDANEILAAVQGATNTDHDFSTVMDEQALIDISLFISEEIVDFAEIIDAEKSAVGGDLTVGEDLFEESCSDCHGPLGTQLNFGDESDPEFVGTIAIDNPWEFLHKAYFGQPYTQMPAGINLGYTSQDYADLLAYTQTLPITSQSTNSDVVALGGVLYDKWWKVIGSDEPGEDNPLWKTQTTNTRSGGDTWRCKECHGWDYKGVDGAYSGGSHMTGFPGIVTAQSKSADDITAILTGQINPDHDFSASINSDQIDALIAFIQDGQVDVSPYINADKTANGDATTGQALFDSACMYCHGRDGKTINFGSADDPEFVGTIAADHPWEFMHKVTFGQPGTLMPAGIKAGWPPQDIADMLAYTQTLPTE